MKIGIVTAMSSERGMIEEMLRDRATVPLPGAARVAETLAGLEASRGLAERRCVVGRVGANEAVLAESGIGKVNAAVGAIELLRAFSPDCLVSTGVAGGLDASLRVMDVVAGAEVAYHDVDCGPGNKPGQVQGLPARFAADPRLLAVALSLPGSPVRAGLMASGDRFISGAAQRDAVLAAQPGALAVEMESGALAQVCHLCGIPFLSLRVISDTPGAANHVAQYKDFWGEMAKRSFGVTRAFLEALPETL